MTEKEIDKLFAQKLKNHASKPSTNAWKRIEAQLGKPEKKPVAWWKWATIGLMAGGFALAGHQLYKSNYDFIDKVDSQTVIVNDTKKNKKIIQKNIQTETTNTKLAETALIQKTQPLIKTNRTSTQVISIKQTTPDLVKATPVGKKNKIDRDTDTILLAPDINDDSVMVDTDLKNIEDKALLSSIDSIELKSEEIFLEKVSVTDAVLDSTSLVKKEKPKKRIKVEITIPSRKKKKGGSQQNQGLSLNLKSVLHNVFDN